MTLEDEILLQALLESSAQQRFWDKVTVGASDVCWPWTAARDKDGYGLFKVDGIQYRAHCLVWRMEHGYIADLGGHHGGCVCHQCDNPWCCNPDHCSWDRWPTTSWTCT